MIVGFPIFSLEPPVLIWRYSIFNHRFHVRSLMIAVGVFALLLIDLQVRYSWWSVRPLILFRIIDPARGGDCSVSPPAALSDDLRRDLKFDTVACLVRVATTA